MAEPMSPEELEDATRYVAFGESTFDKAFAEERNLPLLRRLLDENARLNAQLRNRDEKVNAARDEVYNIDATNAELRRDLAARDRTVEALSARLTAKNAELDKVIREAAADKARIGEPEEEWAIRVVTKPGGTRSYHDYCDPENAERDLALTLQVLADGHDGFGNPVPHGPVSIVKRTVWSTEWGTVEPSEMPRPPAEEAAWSDADRVCAFDGCGESCRHDEENPVPPAQKPVSGPETAGTGSGRGTGVTEAQASDG